MKKTLTVEIKQWKTRDFLSYTVSNLKYIDVTDDFNPYKEMEYVYQSDRTKEEIIAKYQEHFNTQPSIDGDIYTWEEEITQ